MNYSICPTITAYDLDQYRSQIENVAKFSSRLHIDLMDGKFAPTVSPDIEDIYMPLGIFSDIHLMYQDPMKVLDRLIELKPKTVIIHYEAEAVDHVKFTETLKAAGIVPGLALLHQTEVESVLDVLDLYDHVLVFSGHLGYHGGQASLDDLSKVERIKNKFPDMEIAWDGGINDQNIALLKNAGVSVFNVGGFIQKASNPEEAYAKLEKVLN